MLRNLKYMLKLMANTKNKTTKAVTAQDSTQVLSINLSANLDLVREKMGNSMDLIIREFNLGKTRAGLICIDGMVSSDVVDSQILRPLMIYARMAEPSPVKEKNELLKFIQEHCLTAADYKESSSLDEALVNMLSGYTVILLDGLAVALLVNTIGFEARDVAEPETEAVVRGPREGFNEVLQVNTTLLRRRIKSTDLRLEQMTIGRVTKTTVCIAYIQNIVNDKLVDEVKKRLKRINIDGILDSGYIEAFIEDAPFSIFATVGNTEKPDIAAAKMLEGRIVILVDGSPIALSIPYLFIETIQSSEDYYSRWLSGTINRWIRIVSIFITTQLPAFYLATISFNPEVLPTILMITISSAREGVPIPVVVELLFLGFVFEVLKEAGVRKPRPVGQAVSFIGALVIGTAAIDSGLVSAPAVMVTVLTAIGSFTAPAQSMAYVFIRLFLLGLASVFGYFGFLLGNIVILTHMVSLRSFGIPYLSPLAPGNLGNWKDFFIRVPTWYMISRPSVITQKNSKRAGSVSMPRPPKDKKK